jgi:hypothetical protein
MAVPPTTGVDVSTLIAQLDADDWQARDAAEAQLVAKGEAVRPAMVDAAAHAASPEVRSRAAGVIAKLNQADAERPTTVTLHLTAAEPRQAVAALCAASGLRVRCGPDDSWASGDRAPKFTVDLVDRPVWAALRDVCRQAGAVVQLGGPSDTVTVAAADAAAADPLAGPWSGSSRVIVCAKPADGDDDGSLWFPVLVDPRLHLTRSGNRVEVSDVIDDRGRSLLEERHVTSWQPDPLSYFTVHTGPPAAGATKVAVVRGRIFTREVLSSEHVVIEDVARAGPAIRTFGHLRAQLSDWQAGNDDVRYTVRVWTDGTVEVWSESLLMDTRLENVAGGPVGKPAAWDVGHDRGALVYHGRRRVTQPIQGPVRLVWDAATRSRPVTVPFEFHDLPLPKP